ncbi:MAG: hypothetical protein IMZ69_06880 [Spirochaetes bacterium]|nr:hypothetical protein [Spirochaetota bacterium]
MSSVISDPQLLANLRRSGEADAARSRMKNKPKEEVTFLLQGREIPILSARISRSIDTVADGWSVEIEWIPGRDKELDKRIAPYTYCDASIYIGTRLVNTGRLYTVHNVLGSSSLTKQLECWSYTADLVDSMMPPSAAAEWLNSSLYSIASGLCRPLGIGVGISQSVTGRAYTQLNEPFDIVQAELTQTYADLFTKLAFQRGGLVTNDRYGMLLLTMGAKSGPIMATLGEGELAAYRQSMRTGNAQSPNWEAVYDGRKRFATYAVYGQSGDPEETEAGIQSEAIDDKVPPSRRTNIIVSDNTAGNVNVTAAWHRSEKLVQALTIPFAVIGFYTPRGNLWDPNTFAMVKAPSLDICDPTKFLVRQIDYVYTAKSETGVLYLVPPEVYTGEPVKEPWSGRWK